MIWVGREVFLEGFCAASGGARANSDGRLDGASRPTVAVR